MTGRSELPSVQPGHAAAERFVATHLHHLVCDDVAGSATIRGGQTAADAALHAFDVAGYARRRNEVYPVSGRGASRLSPYIRHGLLTLGDVWRHVGATSDTNAASARDVTKFHDELMWQEYARHWYARLGGATRHGIRRELDGRSGDTRLVGEQMACIDAVVDELETDGWLVNQTRMWTASHWALRNHSQWQDGENWLFTHLLDGSRAANRLGWQWTVGVGSSKHYGFSRWQVEKRAPELCHGCNLSAACPIQDWPDDPAWTAVEQAAVSSARPDLAGPTEVEITGAPEAVWLTAESLGFADPALAAHPELPVVFVFDEPLLSRLQLSSKRLVFLVETLAELATTRPVSMLVGDPVEQLSGRRLAVTWAPVPGFVRRANKLTIAEGHPWPWLATPTAGSVSSFSAWRKQVQVCA